MTGPDECNGSSLKPGIPVKLLDTKRTSYVPYDVLRDGTFVVNPLAPATKPAPPTTLRVLMNWTTLISE